MYYKYALEVGVGGQSEVAKEAKFVPPRSKGQHHPLPCLLTCGPQVPSPYFSRHNLPGLLNMRTVTSSTVFTIISRWTQQEAWAWHEGVGVFADARNKNRARFWRHTRCILRHKQYLPCPYWHRCQAQRVQGQEIPTTGDKKPSDTPRLKSVRPRIPWCCRNPPATRGRARLCPESGL